MRSKPQTHKEIGSAASAAKEKQEERPLSSDEEMSPKGIKKRKVEEKD